MTTTCNSCTNPPGTSLLKLYTQTAVLNHIFFSKHHTHTPLRPQTIFKRLSVDLSLVTEKCRRTFAIVLF